MSDEFDPFDVERLRSPEAMAAEAVLRADIEARLKGNIPPEPSRPDGPGREGRSKPTKNRSEKRFTKFPGEQTLAKSRASGSTYAIAIVLLYEAWRLVSQGYRPIVKLTNVMLAGRCIGRKGKKAALLKLSKLGLVTVEERSRKSPLVTVRHLD
jgi:hypothetical protein